MLLSIVIVPLLMMPLPSPTLSLAKMVLLFIVIVPEL